MSGTLIMVLNTLVVISIVVSAIIAVQADKLIHSVIALDAVGCNVFTGICCLLMLMLGLLDKEEGSEAK